MKELIGKKVIREVELNVEGNCKVFGEILKETKFKTGNKEVKLRTEGMIVNATENSVEIFQKRWTENGVDASGWFEKNKFERTFKVVE
jgi:hypothetical protein